MSVLYHYCSTNNFVSILSTQSIWLSSLSLSNDTMEGKLVAEIINRLSKHDGLDESSAKQLQDAVAFVEGIADGLGFCLSEEGDLLSQWRGYAADATGFSIGFSKEYLTTNTMIEQAQSGLRLLEVQYDLTAQETLVRPTYEAVKEILDSGSLKIVPVRMILDLRTDDEIEKALDEYKKAHMGLYMTVLALLPQLYALKATAFREEREWRLISYCLRNEGEKCSYRAYNDRIIPYSIFNLIKEAEPIKEVIIGPKNLTPIHVVEGFLQKLGFKDVAISRSSATYR